MSVLKHTCSLSKTFICLCAGESLGSKSPLRQWGRAQQHRSSCFYLQAQGFSVQLCLEAGEQICARGFLVMQLCRYGPSASMPSRCTGKVLRPLWSKVSRRSWQTCALGHLYGTSSLFFFKGKTSFPELDAGGVNVESFSHRRQIWSVWWACWELISWFVSKQSAREGPHSMWHASVDTAMWMGRGEIPPPSTSVTCRVIKCQNIIRINMCFHKWWCLPSLSEILHFKHSLKCPPCAEGSLQDLIHFC